MAGFIFGGNTPWTYDELQRKRTIAEELVKANMGTPRNVGEGLNAIGRALAFRGISKKADKRDSELKSEFDAQYAGAFGGGGGSYGSGSSGGYTGSSQPPAPLKAQHGVFGGGEAGISLPGQPAGDTGSVAQGGLSFAPETGMTDFTALEAQYGLPEGYLGRTAQIESGGNPNAKNPNSSAAGMFQFIDSTAKQYGLTDKFDPMASADAAARLAADNAAHLRGVLGRDPTAGELYLAHQQGAGGAAKMLANPNDLAVNVVGADAVRLNGGDANMTAGEFASKWTGKFGDNVTMSASSGSDGSGPSMGVDIGTLAELAGNPYATPGQKAVLSALMQQQMDAMDPLRQMEMERARLELDALKNPQPKPGFTQLTTAEVQQLGLPPGVYQRGPDGRIDTVEKTQGVADPIADLKARAAAAGLQEGTPEFQQFMLNNGKAPEGMVIESDGQGGFRMVQGTGAGAAAAKPFTEGQGKDVVFSTRAKGALETLDPIAGALTDRGAVAAGWLPLGLGGGMQSDDYQVAKTAGDEFLQAILRKDTGAAITNDEQALYGDTYLPRPGDNEARLKYKQEARQRAVAAIDAGMSPAQIVAQEKALAKGANPDAAAAPDADGWTTLPSGVKIRVKQ